MYTNWLKFLPLVFTLSACDYSSIRDENSEFYSVPVGSTITLNEEMTIPPDNTSVLLQHGQIKNRADIDFYLPNCKFELYSISENARTVKPDRFEITKVVDENEYTGLQKNTYVASRGMMMGVDAPEIMTYATIMYLKSVTQPDVYRMTCKHWESIVDDRYLTIAEMRQAMGELFTLQIIH